MNVGATMHRRALRKPDGRALWLYGWSAIPEDIVAPAPSGPLDVGEAHLRWHPLRGEWVIYSGARQHRTFLPAADRDPLAITVDPARPTEVPAGDYDIAVFENRFPALSQHNHHIELGVVPGAPAQGACEVVVYGQSPELGLSRLPLRRIELLLEVWKDRTRELGERRDVQYVFVFENRGTEVGVTLHHPHGQIYAYPFVPPLVDAQLGRQREHLARTGHNLFELHVARELADGRRMLYVGDHAVAFVPACARHAYEVWVAPRRAVARFTDLCDAVAVDFARALKVALAKLDGLWDLAMPYVMVFHQAPSDGAPHPEAHLHAEIYPPLRMRDRLKYLAGSELGAGTFAADTLPEHTAAELARIEVTLD